METSVPPDITKLLQAWGRGEEGALDELLPLIYDELRRKAHAYIRHERPEHTLQTTALVNEVYLRLVKERERNWQNRMQFQAVCANMMRQILIDLARARRRAKRGGGAKQVSLPGDLPGSPELDLDWLDLDAALNKLADHYPRKSQAVVLRFFGGLSWPEIADVLQVSTDTAMDDWKFAQLWLRRELTGPGRKVGDGA